MKGNLKSNYLETLKLMSCLESEYEELSKKRLININQRERLAKACVHNIVLRSNVYDLRIYCLCCNKNVHHLYIDTIIIDIDDKFKGYLMNLNYNYYNVLFKEICDHMSKYLKQIINEYNEEMDIEELLNKELNSYAVDYLSGRKLR